MAARVADGQRRMEEERPVPRLGWRGCDRRGLRAFIVRNEGRRHGGGRRVSRWRLEHVSGRRRQARRRADDRARRGVLGHRPLFRRRYRWLHILMVWLVGPSFGEAPETYFAHHIAMHHLEGNL